MPRKSSRPAGELTRETILSVAERLFAAGGFDGVSMRQIGSAADVPFALITYHFETKLGLYKAIFNRRIATFSEQRMEMLRAIRIGDDTVSNFMAIATAIVGPMMQILRMDGGRAFAQLVAREVHDSNGTERGIVEDHFDPLARVAIGLLREAAPDAPPKLIAHAYHFATGALAINYTGTERIKRISDGAGDADDIGALTDELVHFMAYGLIGCLRPDLLTPAPR